MLVEESYYDDAKIAEAELQRLNELVGELRDEIDQLKHAAAGRERKFAVVPLRERTTGTLRPPVYYECTAEGVIVQPEGLLLSTEDLVAPQFSSPVAAASRVVTRFYQEHPETRAANEVGRPYPLLIVRPDGVDSYYRARNALESVGEDFGYQPVGADWDMEFGAANPVLAQWLDEAVTRARDERRGLAAIVPKLAKAIESAQFGTSYGDGPITAGGLGGQEPSGGGVRVRRTEANPNNPFQGLSIEGSLPGEGRGGLDGLVSTGEPHDPAPGETNDLAAAPGTGVTGLGAGPETGSGADSGGEPEGETRAALAIATNTSGRPQRDASGSAADGEGAGGSGQTPDPSSQVRRGGGAESATSEQASLQAQARPNPPAGQGPNQGKSKAPNPFEGVPMVRPIRLYVDADRVVVLPDRAQDPSAPAEASSSNQEVVFEGKTSAQINELLAALKRHADSWGIAGKGMYWDPRLVLNVTGAGLRRADEVRQLLQAAGLSVQAYPVATAAQTGGDRATR